MSLFGWSLPPGCSLRDIDALYEPETPLVAYADDPYRREMVTRLAHTLDDLECVRIAVAELASHGHPNAAAWAVREWLEAFDRDMGLQHVAELMTGSAPMPLLDVLAEHGCAVSKDASVCYDASSLQYVYQVGNETAVWLSYDQLVRRVKHARASIWLPKGENDATV